MTASLRRGFKGEAERLSLSVRAELGLKVDDRLDCLYLADQMGVPVISVTALGKDGARPESVSRLSAFEAGLSALTVCDGTRRLIVYNPAEPRGRRANSLAHELSHIVLEHPPASAIGDGGCRLWDAKLEAEADWLAGALLVPREGALAQLKRGGDLNDGAQHFGVSRAMFKWRVNQTGVARQLEALRRKGLLNPPSALTE